MTANLKSLSLPVEGMTCAGCVAHVESALKELPGVSQVAVNLGINKASLAYDPSQVLSVTHISQNKKGCDKLQPTSMSRENRKVDYPRNEA